MLREKDDDAYYLVNDDSSPFDHKMERMKDDREGRIKKRLLENALFSEIREVKALK